MQNSAQSGRPFVQPDGVLPSKPWCAYDPRDGVVVRRLKTALKFPHIQFNLPHVDRWILHDLDYAGAYYAHDDNNLPPPNFIAVNRENNKAHSGYLLVAPVSRFAKSRLKPIRFCAAIERGLMRKLEADKGYQGLIAKNPWSEHWRVEWRRSEPYGLEEIAEALSQEDMAPWRTAEENVGRGRNVALFDALRFLAYERVETFRQASNKDTWSHWVMEQASNANQRFIGYHSPRSGGGFNSGPLSLSEVRAVARSVERWTWTNYGTYEGRGGEAFSRRQSVVGAAGRAKRWAGHVPARERNLWGPHRSERSYYRDLARARANPDPFPPCAQQVSPQRIGSESETNRRPLAPE